MTSAGLIRTVWTTRVFRLLTWCCVISLAVLTLLPKEEMARTGLPTGLEHVVAYAGSAAATRRRPRSSRNGTTAENRSLMGSTSTTTTKYGMTTWL